MQWKVRNVCVILIVRARKSCIEDGNLESLPLRNITAHLVYYLLGALRPFLMSLLVPQTLLYYPQGKETQSLHAVQSAFQYSWWLERASSGGIPVWLFITLPIGYSATLWNHAIKVLSPFHRRVLHMLIICLEPSPLQVKCGQCLLQLFMWHDLKTVTIPVLFRLKSSFCHCLF